MDFGIDGFLDKFEKYWGTFATRVLVTLVGLAVASFCIGTIWHWLVAPVLTFFQAPGPWKVLVQLLTWGVGTGAGIALGALASYLLEKRRERRGGPRRAQMEALAERTLSSERLREAIEEKLAEIENTNRPSSPPDGALPPS